MEGSVFTVKQRISHLTQISETIDYRFQSPSEMFVATRLEVQFNIFMKLTILHLVQLTNSLFIQQQMVSMYSHAIWEMTINNYSMS